MKTAIWVVVYFTMCFLLFTGWMFAFAQYTPYNGQEHAFSLTYLGFVNGMVASHLLCHSGTINRHSLNGALLS